MLTLGSLFDGIGVFPLAASAFGITPVWASEIQKAPISITRKHFPNMEHLGDISKLDGAKIPPVDIITFGSPCQNLSSMGDRTGLAGEKSSLFCIPQYAGETPEFERGKCRTYHATESTRDTSCKL